MLLSLDGVHARRDRWSGQRPQTLCFPVRRQANIRYRGGAMVTVIEERVPPLGPGDKLTREEFLRRWEAHPEIKRAELIGGIVYMPSPLSVGHATRENNVGTWIG